MVEMRMNVREFVFFSVLIEHLQTTVLTYMCSMYLNKNHLNIPQQYRKIQLSLE